MEGEGREGEDAELAREAGGGEAGAGRAGGTGGRVGWEGGGLRREDRGEEAREGEGERGGWVAEAGGRGSEGCGGREGARGGGWKGKWEGERERAISKSVKMAHKQEGPQHIGGPTHLFMFVDGGSQKMIRKFVEICSLRRLSKRCESHMSSKKGIVIVTTRAAPQTNHTLYKHGKSGCSGYKAM